MLYTIYYIYYILYTIYICQVICSIYMHIHALYIDYYTYPIICKARSVIDVFVRVL